MYVVVGAAMSMRDRVSSGHSSPSRSHGLGGKMTNEDSRKTRLLDDIEIGPVSTMSSNMMDEPYPFAHEDRRNSDVSVMSSDIIGLSLKREPKPEHSGKKFAYSEGQRVEYYSKTNGMWLHAYCAVDWNADTQKAMYSVRMRGSNQRRSGIGYELLRQPLQKGEPCEVFSVKDGWWLVATTTGIANGAVPGYEVLFSQLEGSPPTTSMVSAAIVRRRFPSGSRLVVYRDVERGWEEATAQEPADADEETGMAVTWAPEDGPTPPDQLAFGPALMGPTPSTFSQATIAPAGSQAFKGPRKPNGSPLDCWFMVPVKAKGSTKRELLPSYLVRLHPDYLTELLVAEEKVKIMEFDERQEEAHHSDQAGIVEVHNTMETGVQPSSSWWTWCGCQI